MATDTATPTADTPPPPPPPPPPAETTQQRSADLQTSRVPSGENAEPKGLATPGLQSTPDVPQNLDNPTEARAARQDSAPTTQQSADLQSSRVPPADAAAPPPTDRTTPSPADTTATPPADRTAAQPADTAGRPTETPGNPQAEAVPTRPPESPAKQSEEAGAPRPAQPETTQPETAQPQAADRARPEPPAAQTSETTRSASPDVSAPDPAEVSEHSVTAGVAGPADLADAPLTGPSDSADATDLAHSAPPDRVPPTEVAEPVQPAHTTQAAGAERAAATTTGGVADLGPNSPAVGSRPADGGEVMPPGAADGSGPPSSGPPDGGGSPPPPGPSGDGGRTSASDGGDQPGDPSVVSTFLPPTGEEANPPRAVAGDGPYPDWQDDNGTKEPMDDYLAAVQNFEATGEPLTAGHAALYDALQHAPAPDGILYKGGRGGGVGEPTIDGWKSGLDATLDHGGSPPVFTSDATSTSSVSTIGLMYGEGVDHPSQRLGVSDGSPVTDPEAPVDPSDRVPGHELTATADRYHADYAKEMEKAVDSGDEARIGQLERLRDTVDGRIKDRPYHESNRRENLDETILSGRYELVGLLDTRPGHEYSRGDVSVVQPPGGEPAPPGVYPVWRPTLS